MNSSHGNLTFLTMVKQSRNFPGSITALYPEPGKVLDKDKPASGTSTTNYADGKLRIFFDKKLADNGKHRPVLDMNAGTLEIHHASNKCLYKRSIGNKKFVPENSCTCGQIVAFLWCATGSPGADSEGKLFADVKSGSYYENAVKLAVANKTISGTSTTTFGPDSSCTPGQIVTFLYRADG